MEKKIILILIFCLFVGFSWEGFFSTPASAAGATLSLSPSSGSYEVGDTFSVLVKLHTGGTAIGAVEATLNFPINELEVTQLSKSNSIFTLWVVEPAFSNSNGTISFAGGIPKPGYSGSAGTILTIVFKAKKEGEAAVNFSGSRVLASDAQATNMFAGTAGGSYIISKVAVPPKEVAPPKEEEPVEEFIIPREIPAGYAFTKNLRIWNRNIDVAYLQLCLQSINIYSGNITGLFDSLTKQAVIKFQEKYFDDILAPWGFVKGTGLVSKTTLTKLNKVCAASVEEEIKELEELATTTLEEEPALFDIIIEPAIKEKERNIAVIIIITSIIVVIFAIIGYIIYRKRISKN